MVKRIAYSIGVLSCLIVQVFGSSAIPADAESVSGWGAPVLIETDDIWSAQDPSIAMDNAGNAIVVWEGVDSIWANRYYAGIGWGTAQPISPDDGMDCNWPKAVVDDAGNGVTIWQRSDGIWANRFVVGMGWGTASLIRTDDLGTCYWPALAGDSAGNAIAMWMQNDSIRTNLWAIQYTADSGWGTATLIENSTETAWGHRIAMDDAGSAIAVWMQSDGVRSNIWVNRYVWGAGWGTPELVEDDLGYVSHHEVAIDCAGNAIVLWNQMDEDVWQQNIWARRYVTGSGWDTAEIVDNPDESSGATQIASDGAGNAIVVWSHYHDSSTMQVWANRYVLGSGWSEPELIVTLDSGGLYPQIAVDDSGNGFAVWIQSEDDTNELWASRYVLGTGWGAAEPIDTNDAAESVFWAQVAVDGAGNAVVVWEQYDSAPLGRHDIAANRYVVPTDTVPPVLSISNPIEGAVIESSVVTVSGATEPGATLVINGIVVNVESNGSFSVEIALFEGTNNIAATATDDAGNPTTVTLTVTFTNPVHELEEELSLAEDDLTALRDNLNSTQGELDSVNEDLENYATKTLAFGSIAAIFAALAAVMIVMFVVLRKKINAIEGKSVEKESPPD